LNCQLLILTPAEDLIDSLALALLVEEIIEHTAFQPVNKERRVYLGGSVEFVSSQVESIRSDAKDGAGLGPTESVVRVLSPLDT